MATLKKKQFREEDEVMGKGGREIRRRRESKWGAQGREYVSQVKKVPIHNMYMVGSVGAMCMPSSWIKEKLK